jgi:hypothetical protein
MLLSIFSPQFTPFAYHHKPTTYLSWTVLKAKHEKFKTFELFSLKLIAIFFRKIQI